MSTKPRKKGDRREAERIVKTVARAVAATAGITPEELFEKKKGLTGPALPRAVLVWLVLEGTEVDGADLALIMGRKLAWVMEARADIAAKLVLDPDWKFRGLRASALLKAVSTNVNLSTIADPSLQKNVDPSQEPTHFLVHPHKGVTFYNLCRLYKVPPGLCLNAATDRVLVGRRPTSYINLHYRENGDYSLPEGGKELVERYVSAASRKRNRRYEEDYA